MSEEDFSNAQKISSGESEGNPMVRVRIVGIGGAGNNMITRLKLEQQSNIHLAAINTDSQAIANSSISEKIIIGQKVTRGIGAGGEIELGRRAAEADRELIRELFEGMDLVFLVAALGGGTGSGAGPVVAKIADESGALVIAFVCLPFTFEGARRQKQAENSLTAFRASCDAVIPLPNDLLMQQGEESLNVLDSFRRADEWIGRGINSCCEMLFKTGLINLDLATLRTAFINGGGKTLFGLGRAEGQDYVSKAIESLMLCPMLHLPESSRHADSLLVNIIGGADLSMSQVKEIMHTITEKFGSKANTVMGAVIDENLHDTLEICVIGTTDIRRSPSSLARDPIRSASPTTQKTDAHSKSDSSTLKNSNGARSSAVQEEFGFLQDEAQRGYFGKTEHNFYDGEDLDVPTYLRKGIKISH